MISRNELSITLSALWQIGQIFMHFLFNLLYVLTFVYFFRCFPLSFLFLAIPRGRGQWMDYRCRLDRYCTPTASGIIDPRSSQAVDSFFPCPLYFFPYIHSYLIPLYRRVISFLLFPCANVYEKPHNSYVHTEQYFIFARNMMILSLVEDSRVKN